jgi:hypothetical protein
MRKLRAFWMRLINVLGPRQNERDFADELESHLAMHVDECARRGMSFEQARRSH